MTEALTLPKDRDRRQATVLFADISGFTSLSQRIDPEDASDTMNGCFRIIERVVLENGGTVDKFIGDCVMALFGAPRALEEAPKKAVNAAIGIRNSLADFIAQRGFGGQIDVHVAINTGLVVAGEVGGDVRRDYTVMGPTVNMAARLLDVATAGQIIIGSTTHRYTSREFEVRSTKPLKLKGIDGTTVGYEVLTRQPRVYRSATAEPGHGPIAPMIGREHELRAIEERFVSLGEGSGAIVSVLAEGGMGKSRLVAESRQLGVAKPLAFYDARALALGRASSFHPFIDFLRQWTGAPASPDAAESAAALSTAVHELCADDATELLPFVKTLMGYELERDERQALEGIGGEALEKLVRRSVRRLIERMTEARPLVLVFEDAHWMDESSVGLLETLLPLVETRPILFLLALRPDYEATSERLLKLIDERHEARHLCIVLDPLGTVDCDVLINELLSDAELPAAMRALIKEKAEGNPFYIEEVLRSLIEQSALEGDKHAGAAAHALPQVDIPETIEAVVMSRVDRLDEATRQVLQVAAVVGRRFPRAVLETVTPEHGDIRGRLDTLVAKQFLLRDAPAASRATGGSTLEEEQYVFKHALTQDAIHASLLKRTRRELHTRCAEAYESYYESRPQEGYGLLAYHWMQAERFDKAESYLFLAGEEAARAAASAEALHYFRETYRIYLLVHGEKAEDEKRAVLEKHIGAALLNTGQLVESIQHLNAALRLHGEWVPKTVAALRLKFLVDLPIVLYHLYTDAGQRRRTERPLTHELCAITYDRCRAQNPTDPERNFFDNVASMRHLMRADASKVDHAAGMYAANGAFFAFAGLSFSVARRFLDVAERVVRSDRPLDRFQFLAMSSIVDFHAGDWDGRHDIDTELLEQALRAGLLWDADIYLGFVCERDLRQGKFERARARITNLEHIIQSYGYEFSRSTHAAMTSYLLLEQRRLDTARSSMQAYYAARSEPPLKVFGLSGAARVEVLDGRLDAAESCLRRATDIMQHSPHLPAFYSAAYWNSRLHADLAALEAGETSAAWRIPRSMKRALATARLIARDRPEAYRLTARAYWRLGRRAKARDWWEKALTESERLGSRPESARVAADIGLLLATSDDRAALVGERDPAAWLALAAAEFEALDLDWELLRLQAEVESRGTSPSATH